ncbi:hypothetical protein O5165_24935, partial [Escherichia coli]|nr:hypothetical protein [Escherichia coli]
MWCFVRLLITTTWLDVFMTKHDAIRISQLHQIFPDVQLTERQKDIAVMYVIGCRVEEFASEKG